MSQNRHDSDDFVRQAAERRGGGPLEFLVFLKENKKWWLIPVTLAVLLFGLLVLLGSTGAAPFIYTLF